MPVKVAHFIDTRVTGGAETLIRAIAKNQNEAGFEVTLLHFGHPYISETAKVLGLEEIIVPEEKLYKSIKTTPQFAVKFRRLLKQESIDVLHSHLFGPAVASGLACAFSKIRHVATLHDSYILEERPNRIQLLFLTKLLGSKIVCVSESIRSYIKKNNSLFSTIVIHNGVELPTLSDAKPNQKPVAVCVGRLTPVKNHELLIDAWKDIPNAKLLIVGTGELEAELKAASKGLDIEFTGFCSDVDGILQQSDIFTLTSKSEGLSCSIMEALANALPCVVTNVGGNSEIVEDGHNGFLVNSKPELVEKLTLLVTDSDKRKAMSLNARNSAEKTFSLNVMLDKYHELYQS